MNNHNMMLSAMHEFGLTPTHLIDDGKIHRFGTITKPKSCNGWSFVCANFKYAIFGDWSTGIRKTWRPQGYRFTRQDKVELNLARAAEKAMRIKNHRKAICRCKSIWRQSTSANNHSYILRKGIKPYIARVDRFDKLLVPVCSLEGELMSLQFISSDGQKLFKSGASLRGNAALIGDVDNQSIFLICEGYATGCSIHEATGLPVVVAFNADNLVSVSKSLSLAHPNAKLIICADNDHQTQRQTGVNVGLDKASAVAKQINATLLWPQFEADNHGSDFNDIHCQQGLSALTKILMPVINGVTHS